MIKIKLSNTDDPSKQIMESLDIIKEINERVELGENEFHFDLSNLDWILPCSALLLSHNISILKNNNKKINFTEPSNANVKSYLANVGFPFGSSGSGLTYMPIHHFSIKENEKPEELIEKEIKQIFDVIKNNFPNSITQGMFYLIGELSDNLSEHSKFKNASIMAQFYKNKKYVDIAIIDDGITIPGLFELNSIKFDNDYNSILDALRGISTKQESGRGRGLNSSKRIISEGLHGDLYIISRKGFVHVNSESDMTQKDIKSGLNGTLLHMRFKVPEKDLNIYPFLE